MLRQALPSTDYRVVNEHNAPKAMTTQNIEYEAASTSTTSSYMDEDDCNFDDFSVSSASSDESGWDECLMKIEEQANSFAVMGATPAFAGVVFDQTAAAEHSYFKSSPMKRGLSSQSLSHGLDLNKVISDRIAKKNKVATNEITGIPRSISANVVVTQSPNYSASTQTKQNATFDMKPDDCLHSILREHYGKSQGSPITLHTSSDLKNDTQFFFYK